MASIRLPAQGRRTRLGLRDEPCTLGTRKWQYSGLGPKLKLHRLHENGLHGHKHKRHELTNGHLGNCFVLQAAKRALGAAKRALGAAKRANARHVNGQRPVPTTVA